MNAHRAHDATLNVDQHIGNETAETAALGRRCPLFIDNMFDVVCPPIYWNNMFH